MIELKKLNNHPYIEIRPEDVSNQALDEIISDMKSPLGRVSKNRNNELIDELKSATLLMPPTDIGEDMIESRENGIFLTVFCDIDKYYDYYYDEDSIPNVYAFRDICNLILLEPKGFPSSFGGIIINPGNEDFTVSIAMMEDISGKSTDEKQNHSTVELKKLRGKLNRDKNLSRFISKSRRFNFGKFIKQASKTYMFTYFVSIDDLSPHADDGVINLDGLKGNIFIVDEHNLKCAIMFSSEKLMEPTLSFYKKRGRNIYSQIIDLKTMTDFILKYNLDAVILEYAHNDVIIEKEYFEEYRDKIKKLNKNKSDYSNYAFIV